MYRKIPYDMEKVRVILEANKTPSAREDIKKYLADEVFPSGSCASAEEQTEKVRLLVEAVIDNARRRGYLKDHHKLGRHASAWSDRKKAKFRKYFREGATPEEIFNDRLFKRDAASCNSLENAFESYKQSVGVSAEDRAARAEAVAAKRSMQASAEVMNKPSVKTKEPFKYVRFGPDDWTAPDVIHIPKEAWDRRGKRVACFSRLDFEDEGHRRQALRLAAQVVAEKGIHFPVIAGGLVSHRWFMERERQLFAMATSREDRYIAHARLIEETVAGISSAIPEMRDPDGKLVRWYVMASRPQAYDGPYGDEILRRLERMRPDIRKMEEGGERIEVKDARLVEDRDEKGNIIGSHLESVYLGFVLPKAGRLPGRYMSSSPEREMADVEAQTYRDYPRLWVNGVVASALYKPASGEREVPYITLPAIRKLEAKGQRIAENQSGCSVVELMPEGDILIHVWNFRDLIAQERNFIGAKKGSQEIHEGIVEILKSEGKRTPGQIADAMGLDSETVRKDIAFLMEEEAPLWPGLSYNEAGDQYAFNMDWIRRKLRYGWPDEGDPDWHRDSFISIGCMHAGYTTTDYKFLVETIPEKMLAYDIQTLVGNGDFIAGLHHHFRDTGQVFESTFTDQEIFAAQIINTILIKVFRVRLAKALASRSASKKWTLKEAQALVASCMPFFPFIKGNHDKWQEQEGYQALKTFLQYLKDLLEEYIQRIAAENGLPAIDAAGLVNSKVLYLDPFRPIFDLPSGLRCAVIHPEMGRASASLRLEKELERFGMSKYKCNVVFVANFHTTIFAHKWNPIVGQAVGVQTGATILATDFEFNKTKEVDFGVQMLIVDSLGGRILRTTTASFDRTVMDRPYSPDKEIHEVVKELGILR